MAREGKSFTFQFYPKDFLSDENVVMMTNQEVGCYIKLMAYCWLEGSIPADPKRVAKLVGEQALDFCNGVLVCFQPHPNDPSRLIHPRLEQERAHQERNRLARQQGGNKTANKRWNKNLETDIAKLKDSNSLAVAEGLLKGSTPAPTPTPTVNPNSLTSFAPKENPPVSPPKDPSPQTNASKGDKGKGPGKKTPMPEGFCLTPQMREWAVAKLGAKIDLDGMFEHFCDHHRKKGDTFADWTAAWRTWVNNAHRFGAPPLRTTEAQVREEVMVAKAKFLGQLPKLIAGDQPTLNLSDDEVF